MERHGCVMAYSDITLCCFIIIMYHSLFEFPLEKCEVIYTDTIVHIGPLIGLPED